MSVIEMKVHMDCSGCESKIRKALQKLKGVDDVDIDMRLQKVTVMGWAAQKKVLKTVRNTGRRAEFWPYPYNPQYHNYNQYHQQQLYYTTTTTPRTKTLAEPIISYNAIPASSSSSYNYYQHGYDNFDHVSPYSTIIDDGASAMFSDENPHACSIM